MTDGVSGGYGASESSGSGSGSKTITQNEVKNIAQEGSPGGWGATEGGSGGGRVVEPVKPTTYGGTGGGTYTDASGKQISYEQAQEQGTVDKPSSFAEKAQKIGLTQADIFKQSQLQGKSAEEARALSNNISLSEMQQRILAGDKNISISPEIRQSVEMHKFLEASQRGGIEFAPGAEQRARDIASKLGSVPGYKTIKYEPVKDTTQPQLGDIVRFSGMSGFDRTRPISITPKSGEVSPVGRTDLSGMPIIPSIIQRAKPQEVRISGNVIQKVADQKTQIKAEKWWNSLSDTEKASALVASGTIDISVAGKYFGSKANESKYINQQIKDIAFGSEKGKQYITDVYKTLNIEGSKTQTQRERFEEGLTKVVTGTSAQALAMMVAFGGATKILTSTAKAVGVREAAVAGAEKLVGTSFKVAIAGELGSKVAQGKGGEAIAEAGLIATSLPFSRVGEGIVSGVGKFTPTVEEFTKFTGEKIVTPIRGTETFKFTAGKTPEIVKETGKTFIEKGAQVPGRTIEAGIIGAERIVNIPSNLVEPIRTRFEEGIKEPISRTISSKTEKIKSSVVEKFPEFVRTRIKEKEILNLMPETTRKIYEKLPTEEAKTMFRTAFEAKELIKDIPESAVKKMYRPEVSFGSTKDVGEKGLEVEKIMKEQPDDILLGSLSTAKFVKGYREVRTETPEGVKLGTGIGDIELYSLKGQKYIDIGLSKKDIHDLQHFPNVQVGKPITTSFGGKTVELSGGKGMKPVEAEGIQYLHLAQQASQKLEGSIKYMARKTDFLTGEAYKKEFGKEGGELGGYSLRRGKDVPDVPEIIEALAKAHPEKSKGEKALKLMKEYREAEATKLYAKTPEAVLVETGYAAAKEFLKPEHKALPLFIGDKTTSEYPDVVIKVKSPVSLYPEQKKEVTVMVGGYYPPTVKKETTVYPPIIKDSGYYPPIITRYPYSSPYMDKFISPLFYNPSQPEIPFDESYKNLDEPRKKRRKLKEKVTYKPRESPIFENAQVLFEDKSPLVYTKSGEREVSNFVVGSQKKPSGRRTSVRPIKSTLVSGLSGFAQNPMEKTNKGKSKKNNSNKKQFWET